MALELPETGPLVRLKHFGPAVVWAVALGLALYFFVAAKTILLGFLAAACAASALSPLMDRLPGPRWGRALMAGLAPFLVLAGGLALLGWAFAQPLESEFKQWPELRDRADQVLAGWGSRLQLDDPITLGAIAEHASDMLTGSSGRRLFTTTTTILSGALIAIVFVFFGGIYLLGEKQERLLQPFLSLWPPSHRDPMRAALTALVPQLRWWCIGTVISMAVVGVAAGVGFWLVGVRMALPLAALASLSEIIPTVGPAAAFLLALLFSATQGGSQMMGVVIVYLCVQLVESYGLLPFVMKKTVHIPPVITLFTVVLWGQVFGAAGLLLAIPINLTIWSFAQAFLIERRANLPPAD